MRGMRKLAGAEGAICEPLCAAAVDAADAHSRIPRPTCRNENIDELCIPFVYC